MKMQELYYEYEAIKFTRNKHTMYIQLWIYMVKVRKSILLLNVSYYTFLKDFLSCFKNYFD